MNWLADQLFLLMQGLYDRFGIPIVLIAAISEATVGVGVVFPGQVLMFLAGAYTRSDATSLGLVFVSAFAGTIIGDTISYAAGRWGGNAVEGTRFGPTLRLGRALMMGRTRWMIPFYHLHSVTRAVGPFGAGAIRMPLRVWMPLDFLGAAISNAVWVGAGALFGAAMLEPDGTLKQHPALRIGLYLLAVAWFVAMQTIAQRRLRDLRGEESAREARGDEAALGPDVDTEADREPALRR